MLAQLELDGYMIKKEGFGVNLSKYAAALLFIGDFESGRTHRGFDILRKNGVEGGRKYPFLGTWT